MQLRPRSGVVDEDEQDATLAALVRSLMGQLPWSKARELVRSGRVKVEGTLRFDPAERVPAGALIEIDPTARRRRAPPLEPERLVHVDHDIVVVRKPAGLLTVPHSAPGTSVKLVQQEERDTLIERTRLALREAGPQANTRAGERDRLFVVQRLDEDTTGLLVFARNRKARKALEDQLRAHAVERRYVALVHGRAEAATYETFLVPDRGDGVRGSWRGPTRPPKSAKRARTLVRVEERFADATLVSCQLETGRQHQVRIHLAEAGHPLLGEHVYDRLRSQRDDARLGIARPLLHAASLGFRHPSTDRPLRFEDPLPPDFVAVLERLRHTR